jgi:hypothetical protein
MTADIAKLIIALVVTAFSASTLVGCGVRGRPQPPLAPPELGRGEPTFKRATEEFAFPEVPSPDATPDPSAPTGESN